MTNLEPLSSIRAASPVRPPAPVQAPAAPEAPAPTDGVDLRALPPLETPKKAVTVLAASFGYAEFPQASPDGKSVLFNVVGDYDTSQMILMDSDGGHPRSLLTGEEVTAGKLPAFLASHKGHTDEQGTWADDGRSIYYRTNSQGLFSIARFDVDEASSKVVVSSPDINLKHPVATEDGYILGYGGPPDAKYRTSEQYSDLFLADPRTGSYRLLTHSDGSVSYKHPSEMHGMILAHVEPRGTATTNADLVTVDPTSGREKNLTATPDADERHPFYSAAADLVAFHSDGTGDKNVWIATPDFEHRAQLTFYGKAAQSPSWSPDGRTLYFVKKGEKPAEGEPFFKRQADIRALDVHKALKDLAAQAAVRLKDLQAAEAAEETLAEARKTLEDYRYFLQRVP